MTLYLILSFVAYSCIILLDSLCCFYELSKTATSPKPEGMVFCIVMSYAYYVCLVILAGWLELWLVWTGVPKHFMLGLPWWDV